MMESLKSKSIFVLFVTVAITVVTTLAIISMIKSNEKTQTLLSESPTIPRSDHESDEFYNKSTINVTWLNVWDGSTESWWNRFSSSGTTVLYEGIETNTKSLNWGDESNVLRRFYMDQVKKSGIDAVILDLTNGISWHSACNFISTYCNENGMKFAAAINANSTQDFEKKARQIWTRYASPVANNSSAYLIKENKPLLVAYVGKNTWLNSIEGNLLEYGSKFNVVWASGEDSALDKWGWQAPAKDGPQPSTDSMFVTASINWTAPTWSITGWRRSLAYLDYGFLLARQIGPKYLIVGSYDDMRERNGWILSDTTNASFNHRVLVANTEDNEGTPGLQMRNVEGEISTDAFYNRVKEWLTLDTASPYYPDGIINDGVYLIRNAYSGNGLTSTNPSAYNPEDGRFPNDFTNDRAKEQMRQQADPGYQQYMFFYHLGNDEYRIIRLCIGFSLEDNSGSVIVNWDSNNYAQHWVVGKVGENYQFINKLSGKAMAVLSETSAAVTSPKNHIDEKQQWILKEIAVFN